MNIGVIGTGRLGLSFALLCEQKGFTIIASDKNLEHIQRLQDRTHKTTEPLVEEWLQTARKIVFTTSNRSVIENSDVVFLFVPTPSLPSGEYDHQYIEEVINEMESYWHNSTSVPPMMVIGCTVMPGYTQSLQNILKGYGVDVIYNPEFIAQGDIIRGLTHADMVLIGTTSEPALHALTGIYRTIMSNPAPRICAMSPTAAEITKISINCYLTMKIAYANMIGEIAINSHVENEVNTILAAIGSDSRIGSKFLGYGYGFSGVCLPRDNRALAVHAEEVGVKPRIPTAVDDANIAHNSYLFQYLTDRNSNRDIPFQMYQLAYKKGVDILTESAPYQLCKDLLAAGYTVSVKESESVEQQVRKELPQYEEQLLWGEIINSYKITI